MKILLSGGLKTKNIVNGVSKKFQSSGDEFIVVEFIDDIADIFTKGDYYDKAIITEQSINREYSIKDEYEIRRRINQFADECAMRGNKQSYVFLTQNENIANCIYEEILPIQKNSVVVYKKPQYSVGFFYELIVSDVHQIRSDWVYKPADISSDMGYTSSTGESDIMGFDVEETSGNIPPAMITPDDIIGSTWEKTQDTDQNDFTDDTGWVQTTEDIVDNQETEGPAEQNWGEDQEWNNQPAVDEGSWDNPTHNGNDWVDNNQPADQQWNNQGTAQNWGSEVPVDQTWNNEQPVDQTWNNEQPVDQTWNNEQPVDQNNNQYWNDPSQNTQNNVPLFGFDDEPADDIKPIKQSGDLPNYGAAAAGMMAGAAIAGAMGKITNNNSGIPGFDDEDVYNHNKANDMYGDFNPGNNQFTPDGNQGFDGFGNNEQYIPTGFDYDDPQPQNQFDTGNDNSVPLGFSPDDYNNDNTSVDGKTNPAIAAGAVLGNNNNQQVGSGKKGLRGLLNKGGSKQVNNQQQPVNMQQQNNQNVGPVISNSKVNVDSIRARLKPFATRGNSIAVTGCGGCGTSTIAFSIANILNQLGYTVLLVDMDTEHKAQSYISSLCYDSISHDSANLMAAINSTNGIGNYTSVVKTGFHLLTMGLASDANPVQEMIHKEKISRFMNVARTNYNFVIYDIPFKSAVDYLAEMIHMSDNVALVVDASNWGITKTLVSMCNIPSDEMQDSMFNRAQLVFNKYRSLHKVFDKKIKTGVDITALMDEKVFELIGEDIGLHFSDMHIAGIINDNNAYEDGWFSNVHFSDTHNGQQIYLKLVEDIILKG